MSGVSQASGRAFAVVPAAGRSVRMGSPKLLLPWGESGQAVVEHVLTAWKRSRAASVVVTVHRDDAELADRCRACGVEVAVPEVAPPDMKSSIRAALEFVRTHHTPTANDVWMTAPADLPFLDVATIDLVVAAALAHSGKSIRPVHAGRRGHPVAFPWSAAELIDRLPSDRGIDALFEHFPPVEIEAGPGCVADDLDTPDDYRRLARRHDRHHP